MTSSDDARLVILSVVITIIVSYKILKIAERVTATVGFARKFWLASGAMAIRSGWSISCMGIAIAPLYYTRAAMPIDTIFTDSWLVLLLVTTLVILVLQTICKERRRGIEAALAESQRRMATLIDSLPGIVFACNNDPSWSMNYVSEGCLELTGYTSQELAGTKGVYNAITHPEDISRVFQTIDTAISQHQPYVVEYRILTKSGQQKWLWEKGNGVFDSQGQVLGLEGFITDITELKRSEAALRTSERKYRELFKSHPYPMWVYDQETLCFLDVNQAAVEHYGYTRDEFLAMTLKDLRPAADVPGLLEHILPKTPGLTHSGIWRHCKQDGTTIDVEITSHTLVYADKQAKVVAVNDVTQRLQTEAALRQAEAKYRSIFENAIEGIFQTTPDGRYLSANPALARILGYDSAESLITSISNIEQQLYVDPNQRVEFIALLEQNGTVSGFETQVYRQDGSIIWISKNARAIKTESGTLLYYEGYVENITKRKQTEALQARFTAIMEATTDIVGISDLQGNSLYLNQAGRKLRGLSKNQELTSRKIAAAHPEWAKKIIQTEGIPAALAGEVWTGETAVLTSDGQEIPVSQVILAHRSPEGKVEFLATIMRDISDRKQLEAQLAYLAHHDPLTGLLNRRHFQQQLEQYLALAQRYDYCGALLFIDLDEFKDINDTLGHQAGDALLQSLAKLLQTQLRETDILARLGGDEFAIMLPQTSAAGVHLLTQRLWEALQHHVVIVNGKPIRISASIGVTLFPDHGNTADELLAHADLAMYKAKENGRNCLSVYTPDANWRSQVEAKTTWKNRIREALEQDRFVLYHQPISDLHNDQTSRHELLLRLLAPTGEIMLPNTFLPIAESSGLICQIDRWVVYQAIHLIAAAASIGHDLQLEVNLSGKSLVDDELLLLIQRELASTGINPASLILEITETVAIANIDRTQKFIRALKQIGCKFALDDFGMGYASFSQLKQLPVDYLKIDGSFIRNLPVDAADQHVVKAIVEFSHGLAKSTIAEFVGDEGTVQLLRCLGVDGAQGYYIGQPRPVTELLEDLALLPPVPATRLVVGC